MKKGGDSRTLRNLCEISDVCKEGQDTSFLGNGYCANYPPYNTLECCWDGGDCVKVFGDCVVTPKTCQGDINSLGDGYCQRVNFKEGCCWDGGDCIKVFANCVATPDTCLVDADNILAGDIDKLGNGSCEHAHFNEGCCWDGGDCEKVFGDCIATPDTCQGGFINYIQVDDDPFNQNQCDIMNNNEGCCWDGGACKKVFGDCIATPETCGTYLLQELGDTSCNPVLLTAGCCWDGGDCEKVVGDCKATYETCPWVSGVGNEYCDDGNNNKGCCWDGGDCSGLGTGVIIGIVATVIILVGCVSSWAFLKYKRRHNHSSAPQPGVVVAYGGPPGRGCPPPAEATSSAAEARRELILRSIIHLKVKSGSKVPAEQAEGDMDLLPPEEILSLRTLTIIPVVPIGTAAEQLNGDADDGVFGSAKDNITVMDDVSSYSPKACPICCKDYVKGDNIAWSKNEQCCHAFHTDCIIEWLMDRDDCPMCRNNYLEETEEA